MGMHPVFFAVRNVYEETMNLAGRKHVSGSRKSGFTLIELLVYIGIVGIIVIVAGRAFSNSTKMRMRTQSMLKASEVAENVASLIKDDIAQMGSKSSQEGTADLTGNNDTFAGVYSNVYMHPDDEAKAKRDSSSFKLDPDKSGSDFRFRRVSYDALGRYRSIVEVHWFKEGKLLKRSCWTIAKRSGMTLEDDDPCREESEDDAPVVVVAEDVESFVVEAGKPIIHDDEQLIFPTDELFMLVPRYGDNHYHILSVNNNGKRSVLTGFAGNFDLNGNVVTDAINHPENAERNQLFAAVFNAGVAESPDTWRTLCAAEGNHFTLLPDATYEISFWVPPPSAGDKMGMFNPGRDFLSVGLRSSTGAKFNQVDDFLFYPPTGVGSGAPRHAIRFSVPEQINNACVVFSFVSFSPVTSQGTLTIDSLKVKKVATASYSFDGWNPESATNIKDKKNVKAVRVSLRIKKNGESGEAKQVIQVPSNGPRD